MTLPQEEIVALRLMGKACGDCHHFLSIWPYCTVKSTGTCFWFGTSRFSNHKCCLNFFPKSVEIPDND